VLATDRHEGAIDLHAGQPFGLFHGLGDRVHRLVDVDDLALLEAGRGHRALADDGQAAVTPDLADERRHLAGADVDPDEDRFSFHSRVASFGPV
jgi:hypothetical protein